MSLPLVIPDETLNDLLHKYTRDLTELERQGRFDPITGRDQEIETMILILLQKGRKNVMLLAPPGVGKTALAVGLAQQVVKGNVPEYLKDARVIEIDLASMAAGTSGPAEFQGRFIPLCRGVAERYHRPEYPKVILFMDEIHTIMPTVEGSAYRGLSEVMKPWLTVGDLHVIGATTRDEHRMFVAADQAMDRRFQKLHLVPPDFAQTVMILENIKSSYERHHRITVPRDVIEKIVRATDEHVRRRAQPDKSIIVMDAACAYHVMKHGTGGELSMESAYAMISRETGVHEGAIGD